MKTKTTSTEKTSWARATESLQTETEIEDARRGGVGGDFPTSCATTPSVGREHNTIQHIAICYKGVDAQLAVEMRGRLVYRSR